MRLQLEKQLLFLSLLCILSKVCAQLCRRPCYCPWVPPRCPRGSPLVLDGCGCCKICARRLGEPCDFLHVCDQSQGLVCDYSTAPAGTGGTCNFEDDEEGCEVNGRVYRDGEIFQPSCKLQCRCLDGGFTCIPLCQEDVRLPTPDCPYPRRVEIPGKCCPEWICGAQDQHLLRDARAGKMQGTSREGMPGQVSGDGPFTPGSETSPRIPLPRGALPAAPQGICTEPGSNHPLSSPLLSFSPRGTVPSAAIPLPGVEHRVERLLGHLWRGLCHPRLQPEPLLPAGDSEAALRGQTLPCPARSVPGEGKRRSFVAVPTLVSSRSQRLIPAKSLAQTYGIVVLVKMEKLEKFPSGN
ncbi:WNT1-inducible-signaling pathway protein 2 isoform X1 [Corapipo altera]|uniref:WNT1-inducible-signaling pathway protein 2 isoform X1 n=1 Tax=Corapipo altera TaxID=415028 RepID=UPI000FD66FCE|nr:WNT1-inducible-signaling pathway protein 2 isoform X1 [Corapipo altera]